MPGRVLSRGATIAAANRKRPRDEGDRKARHMRPLEVWLHLASERGHMCAWLRSRCNRMLQALYGIAHGRSVSFPTRAESGN